MSVKSLVKQVLIQQQNKRYERLLSAKTVTYDTWIRRQEKEAEPSQNLSDSCLDKEKTSFVCFLEDGVKPSQHAFGKIAEVFKQHPEVMVVYGDEDVMDASGRRFHPWFKPDWSPDLFKTSFYLGGLVAVRKDLAKVEKENVLNFEEIYGCLVCAGGFQKGCKSIYHVPEILCHNESPEQMEKWLNIPGEKTDVVENNALPLGCVSVIIPSKDHPEILQTCLKGIKKTAGKLSYEILVVDNGSSEENKQKTEEMLQQYEQNAGKQLRKIQYIYEPMEFNFSLMCNLGAQKAGGELYLFLNDDVELVEENTLQKLAELALQEYTGAVGMKLYYPDSVRLQHAGVTNLPMGPVHKLQFLEDNIAYYFDSNRGLRNMLAVTAACLMVTKDKFTEAGGFSEELQVAFNDVDFCFSLYELGYHNVCRNDCFAYHHESLSRGDDESTEKWLRLMKERAKLYERHPGLEGMDPYFGAGLLREGLDSRIRSAYETAANKVQHTGLQPWNKSEESCRKDACLMVRVEDCRWERMSGYGVVLGDNNACYAFELLLKHEESSKVYAIALEGQYRPDLVENMKDQINVALCGFDVQPENMPPEAGTYQIGMCARNRVTGLCLINYSSRILKC